MRNSPIVRRLVVLLATSGLLGAAFLTATPAVTAFNPHPPCTSAYVTSTPDWEASQGRTVVLTASSTGCNIPAEYQFYLQPPGGSWVAQGAFSTATTFTWNTTGRATGIWGIGVRARASGTRVAYDAYYTGTFTLWIAYCQAAGFNASIPASPQMPGTSVVFSAWGSGACAGPLTRFLVLAPGGSWKTLRPYSPSPTFTWNTTGLAPGTWQIGVWVRAPGSHRSYDAYAVTTYTLLPPDSCLYLRIAPPSVPSPQVAGTVVAFTVFNYYCSGTTPAEVEFWRLAPGGSWAIVQPYSATLGFSWDTTGFANGQYKIGVWIRPVGSAKSYDTYDILTYYIGT